MERRVFTFVVLAALLAESVASALQQPSSVTKKDSGPKCEIWSITPESSQGSSTLLRVSLQNGTPGDIVIKGIEARLTGKDGSSDTVLRNSGSSYWSWIDPETKGALKINSNAKGEITRPEKKIILPAAKGLEFTIDLAKLQWTNELSSARPPAGTLYAVLPAGTYKAFLNFSGEGSAGHISCESNRATVEIRKNARAAQ